MSMIEASSTTRKITLADAPEFFALPESDDSVGRRRFALLIFCDSDAQVKLLEKAAQGGVWRYPPAELVVDDPAGSRQHARFTLKNSTVWFEVLDSRNGTFLRGKK